MGQLLLPWNQVGFKGDLADSHHALIRIKGVHRWEIEDRLVVGYFHGTIFVLFSCYSKNEGRIDCKSWGVELPEHGVSSWVLGQASCCCCTPGVEFWANWLNVVTLLVACRSVLAEGLHLSMRVVALFDLNDKSLMALRCNRHVADNEPRGTDSDAALAAGHFRVFLSANHGQIFCVEYGEEAVRGRVLPYN